MDNKAPELIKVAQEAPLLVPDKVTLPLIDKVELLGPEISPERARAPLAAFTIAIVLGSMMIGLGRVNVSVVSSVPPSNVIAPVPRLFAAATDTVEMRIEPPI